MGVDSKEEDSHQGDIVSFHMKMQKCGSGARTTGAGTLPVSASSTVHTVMAVIDDAFIHYLSDSTSISLVNQQQIRLTTLIRHFLTSATTPR